MSQTNLNRPRWSKWQQFPDPRKGEMLISPIGPGVYRLRNARTKQLILFGNSKNVAARMSSLMPHPLRAGTRVNEAKIKYVWENLAEVEYQTLACTNRDEVIAKERELRKKEGEYYIFKT